MPGERSEDAALSGILALTMGGRVHEVPVLKLRHSKEWKNLLGASVKGVEMDDDIAVTIGRVANLAADTALDLVVAYDRSGVLGGRDGIEDAATDAELFAALEAMTKVTYPFEGHVRSVVEAFGPQLRSMGAALLSTAAERLSRASSTSTPSADGGSTPTPLKSVSPTSSSSSSGPTTSRPRKAAG